MRPKNTLELSRFKGVNYEYYPSVDPVAGIKDCYFQDLFNFMLGTSESELIVRPGFKNIAHTGWPSTAFSFFTKYIKGSTDNKYVGTSGTTLYVQNASGVGSVSTFNTLTHAATTWGVQYSNNLYLLNYNTTMYKYDGTGESNVAGSPSLDYGINFKDRLFAFNSQGSNPSRLVYSNPGDFETFPGINFIDISPGDGQLLTGLSFLGEKLIIFKTKSVHVLYVTGDPSNWILKPLSLDMGCISRYSVKYFDGQVYFISHKGVYRTDGSSFQDLSAPIERQEFPKDIDNMGSTPSFLNRYHGGIWRDYYIITLDTNQYTANPIYLYNFKYNSWFVWGVFASSTLQFNDVRLGFFLEDTERFSEIRGLIAVPVGGTLPPASFIGALSIPPKDAPSIYKDNGNLNWAYFLTEYQDGDASSVFKTLFNVDVSLTGYTANLTIQPYIGFGFSPGSSFDLSSIVPSANATRLVKLRAGCYRNGLEFGLACILSNITDSGGSRPLAFYKFIFDYLPRKELVSQVTSSGTRSFTIGVSSIGGPDPLA